MPVSRVLNPDAPGVGRDGATEPEDASGDSFSVTESDDRPEVEGLGMLDVSALVDDPRDPRGVRHSLVSMSMSMSVSMSVSVLAIAVVAVLAGAKNLLAIAERAADLSQDRLRRLGAWRHPRSGWFIAPSYGTLSRVVHGVDAAELDRLAGGWLPARARQLLSAGRLAGVALDGKVLRGAPTETGVTIAQVAVPDETTETTRVEALLDGVDLAGMVGTADAAHTNAKTAAYLVEAKRAGYVLPVKGNQPGLPAAVAARLDGPSSQWEEYLTEESGRGRIERRTLRVVSIDPDTDGIDFPHAAQVYRLRRDVLGADRRPLTKQVVFGITCLSVEQARPADLAGLIRGQWAVECVHWLRNVCTGCAMSSIARTALRSPAPPRRPWLHSVTFPST